MHPRVKMPRVIIPAIITSGGGGHVTLSDVRLRRSGNLYAIVGRLVKIVSGPLGCQLSRGYDGYPFGYHIFFFPRIYEQTIVRSSEKMRTRFRVHTIYQHRESDRVDNLSGQTFSSKITNVATKENGGKKKCSFY